MKYNIFKLYDLSFVYFSLKKNSHSTIFLKILLVFKAALTFPSGNFFQKIFYHSALSLQAHIDVGTKNDGV
jgi:hypothetical protein